MNKLLIASLFALFLGQTAFADFPAGQYQGHGAWKDDKGDQGTYDITVTSSATSLDNIYTYGNQTQHFAMDISSNQNGFFNVSEGGQTIGQGYCMTVQCHYAISDSNLEESIVFLNGHLYRVGSKTVNGTRIGWEEDLQETAQPASTSVNHK